MAKYSITKDPTADNIYALAQKDLTATAIEVTKNPGNDTVTFQKNAASKARIVKAGSGVAFVPTDISGIAAWFRADSLSAVGDGNPVATWSDESGNSRDATQGVGAEQPLWRATGGPGGTAAVDFDGADDQLVTAGFTLIQPEHYFVVFKQDSWVANRAICDGLNVNTGLLYQTAVTPDLIMFAGASGSANSAATVGSWFLGECLFKGGSAATLKIGATTVGPEDVGTLNMGGVSLGARGSGVFPGNCHIAEYCLWPSEVTGTDLTDLRSYFSTKYGV